MRVEEGEEKDRKKWGGICTLLLVLMILVYTGLKHKTAEHTLHGNVRKNKT